MNKIRVHVDNMFHKYDKNKSGHLDEEESKELLNDLYQKADVNLDEHKRHEIFALFDQNSDGYITKQELMQVLVELKKK